MAPFHLQAAIAQNIGLHVDRIGQRSVPSSECCGHKADCRYCDPCSKAVDFSRQFADKCQRLILNFELGCACDTIVSSGCPSRRPGKRFGAESFSRTPCHACRFSCLVRSSHSGTEAQASRYSRLVCSRVRRDNCSRSCGVSGLQIVIVVACQKGQPSE